MPTQAQIDAARRNGAKSHGPKTPEGKAISSMNALRHGMTAQAILLTNENSEAFQTLAAAYYEKFQPADDVKRDLIDEMVVSRWRQRRDWSNEAALFDLEMDRQTKKVDAQFTKIDHACRYALAFRALADESKAIQLFTRYETSHRRSYYKALTTLLHLRAQPAPTPAPVEPPPSKDVPEVAEKKEYETNPTSSDRPASNDEPRMADIPETQINGEKTDIRPGLRDDS
jgi:hypothetical protein